MEGRKLVRGERRISDGAVSAAGLGGSSLPRPSSVAYGHLCLLSSPAAAIALPCFLPRFVRGELSPHLPQRRTQGAASVLFFPLPCLWCCPQLMTESRVYSSDPMPG